MEFEQNPTFTRQRNPKVYGTFLCSLKDLAMLDLSCASTWVQLEYMKD